MAGSTVSKFTRGGYRFLNGVFQYSAGVAAEPGFEIIRARFAKPVPIDKGFERIEAHLAGLGRPIFAFCACELRSPRPFDDAGFLTFNKSYVEPLKLWGIIKDEINPIARSNVCPAVNPPSEPSFYAFSYTLPVVATVAPTFVVAGSGEAPEGQKTYGERAVRIGEHSPDAIREKAQWVLREMERRMAALGVSWADSTATHLYTIYDIHHIMADEIVRRGAASAGLTWQFCRPPVDVLDYEMDVRGARTEIVLS
jgi:hypothetical protein